MIYLELFTDALIEGPIIVEDVDEFQFMSHANFIIVWIVCRGDFYCSSPKLHIDDDIIRNNWNPALDERMFGKLSMQMLYPCQLRVVWRTVSSFTW